MRIRPPHAPNSLYHVTLRGIRQQPLFYDTYDRRLWQHLLSKAMSRYGARLHLYCWMTNHIHMVLQCGDAPIFKTLHWAAGGYARIFNTKYAHVGHLFQDRYGSRLIHTDAYLLQLVKYIHANPVAAGMVDAPGESIGGAAFRAYAHAFEPEWLTSAFVLALFSDDPIAARSKMIAFTNAPEMEPIAAEPPEDPFELPTTTSDLDDLNLLAGQRFAIDPTTLSGPSRSHAVSKARVWIAWTAQQKGIATLTEVAKHFGRHPSALSRSLARYKPEFEGSSTKQVNATVPGTNKSTIRRRGAPSGSMI